MKRSIAFPILLLPLPLAAASKVLPVLNHPLTTVKIGAGLPATTIPLAGVFGTEPIDDQVVRFTTDYTTSEGPVVMDMAIFSNRTPATRTNFLKYVSDGDYVDSFVHRSVPGFVIQGGGFRFNASNQIASVPADPAVVNEFGISNTYGTVAMAKVGSDPNSATSQWFVSLGDNSANLDNQNGGFTVFARVTKSSLENAATFGDGVTFPVNNYSNINGALNSLPLYYTHTSAALYLNEFITFSQVGLAPITAGDAGESTTLTYSVAGVANNTAGAGISVEGSNLVITPAASQLGSATVTVRATDSVGNLVDTTFVVQSVQSYPWWKSQQFSPAQAADASISGAEADPDGDGISNLQLFLHGLSTGPVAKNPVSFSDQLTGTDHRPQFVFPIRNDIAGVSYTLEKSADLGMSAVWTSVPVTEVSRVTPTTGATNIDTLTIRATDAAGPGRSFYRLRFTTQ